MALTDITFAKGERNQRNIIMSITNCIYIFFFDIRIFNQEIYTCRFRNPLWNNINNEIIWISRNPNLKKEVSFGCI